VIGTLSGETRLNSDYISNGCGAVPIMPWTTERNFQDVVDVTYNTGDNHAKYFRLPFCHSNRYTPADWAPACEACIEPKEPVGNLRTGKKDAGNDVKAHIVASLPYSIEYLRQAAQMLGQLAQGHQRNPMG